jgi:hypothetical protein
MEAFLALIVAQIMILLAERMFSRVRAVLLPI